MRAEEVEAAIAVLRRGAQDFGVPVAVRFAASLMNCPSSLLIHSYGDRAHVLLAHGIDRRMLRQDYPRHPFDIAYPPGRVLFGDELKDEPFFRDHPMMQGPDGWKFFLGIPLSLPLTDSVISLWVGDPRVGAVHPIDITPFTTVALMIADMIQTAIELIGRYSHETTPVAAVAEERAPPPTASRLLARPDDPAAVSAFLFDTLVAQRRVKQRGAASYHTVLRWRAAVKPWQIAALRSLKRYDPDAVVDRGAGMLVDAARDLFGARLVTRVTNVPCGNSGPDCLACRLAHRVAEMMDVPYVAAFEDLPVTGSSHPRRNARRPAMRLKQAPDEAILLIDDVVTSGAHVEEACDLLRPRARAVFPIALIGE